MKGGEEMPRTHIQHTQNGTVAHGYIIQDAQAVSVNYMIEGKRLNASSAENYVRRNHDPTFAIDTITHFKTRYRMPIKQFLETAEVYDIEEEGD